MRTALALFTASLAFSQRPRVVPTITEGCPPSGASQIPGKTTEQDYVEVGRTRCFGSCPDYTVRVYRSGMVAWEGKNYVAVPGRAKAAIDPTIANEIVERFRLPEFWALCERYSASISDQPTVNVEVNIGGVTKKVSDYADSAPAFVQDLENAIDAAADSHRWRHGDPRDEPLIRIREEYLPKPGLTALMRAAATGDAVAIQSLLAADPSSIKAVDASGWTALMYGVTGVTSRSGPLLIQAGADVNHRSPAGDTPLMANAYGVYDGNLSADLLGAGARINDQNAQGISTLMILAQGFSSKGITDALMAGADVSLKDRQGRSALDYLEAAHCSKRILAFPPEGEPQPISGTCNVRDEAYKEAKALLEGAAGKRR